MSQSCITLLILLELKIGDIHQALHHTEKNVVAPAPKDFQCKNHKAISLHPIVSTH